MPGTFITNPISNSRPKPITILEELSSYVPNRVWTDIENLRAKIRNRVPAWCWMPYQVIGNLLVNKFQLDLKLINVLHPLSAWRATKGIYRINEDLLNELTKTSLSSNVPVDILVYLPEWCVYVELPHAVKVGKANISGFFAMMSLDETSSENPFLVLVWVYQNEPSLDLDTIAFNGTIVESVDAFIENVPFVFRRGRGTLSPIKQEDRGDMVERLGLVIPILTYLASVGKFVDIQASSGEDFVRRLPKGKIIKSPQTPKQWNVGWRIGPELKKAAAELKPELGRTGKGHASPRPHIRRAHFRKCRVGVGRQDTRTVWIPSFPVNFRYGPTITVVRPVK
jgi:hypothetical protein